MKNSEFDRFLTDNGKVIFEAIRKHCIDKLGLMDVDVYELAMLANSFDAYAINAQICKETGYTQSPKEGGWDQIRPEYTVMKNEYAQILKHSAKFGLNPGDRSKIFNMKEKGKTNGKGNEFDLSGKHIKVA